MGKKKSPQQTRNRQKSGSPLDEINNAIEALQGRVAQVEDLRREGFPYRDALRARAELQLRETIRKIFGERSSEFQRIKHHRLISTNEADIARTLVILNDLIRILEDQRLDVMGVRPSTPSPAQQPPSGNSSATPGRIPAIGSPQLGATAALPSAASVASTDQSVPTPTTQRAPSAPSATAQRSLSGPHGKPQSATPGPRSAPGQGPVTPHLGPAGGDPSLSSRGEPALALGNIRDGNDNLARGSLAQISPSWDTQPQNTELRDFFARLMTIGHRFHFVARQLRLRREYRATLEVEDRHDVQDLFLSLLRLDFADISTEEWMPSYAEFSSHATVLVHHGQLGVVLKKTKPGWGPKELVAELAVDAQHYASYRACRALFCFVYDPEGRIGDPRIIESEESKTAHGLSVHVLISPK